MALEANDKPSNRMLRFALLFYTTRPKYLKQIRLGEPRYDLSGEQVGQVTEEDAQNAASALQKLKEKEKAQKAKPSKQAEKPKENTKEKVDFLKRPVLKLKKKAK